jgi:zinc protease
MARWQARSRNQAYLGRTWSRSGEVDAAIEKMTAADVNAVLRKYLKPEDIGYAFAGEFAKKK